MIEPFDPHIVKNPKKAHDEYVFKIVISVLVFLLCGVSLLYLSHANSVATKGYKIKQVHEEKRILEAERDIWNLKLTRVQSIQTISSSEKVAMMKDFSYLPEFIKEESQVAMR